MNSFISFLGGNVPTYRAKNGDKLVFPIEKRLVSVLENGEDVMKVRKLAEGCNDVDRYVDIDGIVRKFECETSGEVLLRINDFPKGNEHKQFAIEICGKQVGKAFIEKATSLRDYVAKIVAHYEKTGGVKATAMGNTVLLKTDSSCGRCGEKVRIVKGSYNELNKNNPSMTTTVVGNVNFVGSKDYVFLLVDVSVGNVLTVDGKVYVVKEGDTVEKILDNFYNGEKRYVRGFTDEVIINSVAGSYLKKNENTPTLLPVYHHSDTDFDYYTITVENVVEGNMLQLDGILKTVKSTDSDATMKAAFETNGYYKVTSGKVIDSSVFAGSRRVTNASAATFRAIKVAEDAPRQKKRYTIEVTENVQKGNVFRVMDAVYVAKDGDTANDVGRALGGDMRVFTVDVELLDNLLYGADNGFRYGQESLANVTTVSDTVGCCEKDFVIAELDLRLEDGTYVLELLGKDGMVRRSNCIEVGTNYYKNVVYGNDGNAFGLPFGKGDYFECRLPIYLHNAEFLTNETEVENINGFVERGEVEVTKQRSFTVSSVSTELHEFVMRVLKSNFLQIDGIRYIFKGDYVLDAKVGTKDLRMATGTLLEIDTFWTNARDCR